MFYCTGDWGVVMEVAAVNRTLRNTGISVAFIAVLVVATYQRNSIWYSLLSLWEDVAIKSPQKSRVHNNLGNCNVLLDRYFQALEEYRKAVELDTGNIEAYYNLAITLEKVGIANQAAYYYDVFCKNAPAEYKEQKMMACERSDRLSRGKSAYGHRSP